MGIHILPPVSQPGVATKSRTRKFRKYNPRKQGKQLEVETVRSLKGVGLLHRLYDTQDWQDKTGNPNIMVGKQPADFFWIYNGRIWFIECKSTTKPLPMTLGDHGCNFKPHQLATGSLINIHGQPLRHSHNQDSLKAPQSILHVHFIAYYPAEMSKKPIGWVVPTVRLYDYFYRSGIIARRAIPLAYFDSNGYQVERTKGQSWNLIDALLKASTQIYFK